MPEENPEDYVGQEYQYFDEIPEFVVDSDELALVSLGVDEGYRVISVEQYEGKES